jgi:hypothetical protein
MALPPSESIFAPILAAPGGPAATAPMFERTSVPSTMIFPEYKSLRPDCDFVLAYQNT